MNNYLKISILSLFFILIVIMSGCDIMYGVSRHAKVNKLPDFESLVADIKSYPEINKVELKEYSGHGAYYTYSIYYQGGDHIHAVILFQKEENGDIYYYQNLWDLNRPPSQEDIAATTPIMLRIEKDLETKFGFTDLQKNVQVNYNLKG